MLVIATHRECQLHDNGPEHPENARRLDAISDQLLMSGLEFSLSFFDAPLATVAQLTRAHDVDYVERVLSMDGRQDTLEIDPETLVSSRSVPAALRAAGAGVLGVDLIMKKEAGPVFCAVRPPGHHAERARGMGFCIFNNVAVAACHALSEYGIDRIAIADFDAHHGNGTQDIFANDRRVLVCSTFQDRLYPHSGEASDTGSLVNVPLAPGTGGSGFRQAVTEHWLPALAAFRPEFVLVSAGFDGHRLDDMSDLRLEEADFAWVTERLYEVARTYARGRLLSTLEGGYEPGALARSVVSHLKALLGNPAPAGVAP
jgi:acetoin utilization deacetylase AcuC-like enzyme